ncbi:MAG: glucokinase [Anaerolineae bacterium]|jgi:glucokinase
MLLAGDIGGTKTHLAIYSKESSPHQPVSEAIFPSAMYPNLETLAREFLAQTGQSVERATFGVAGPVVNGRVEGTNLPWIIEEGRVADALQISSVKLLNDLEAIAYAVLILEKDDLYTLNEGDRAPHGSMAVIAPGTGLGQGFITWTGNEYRAYPSEGGHADFAPNNDLEMGLLRYLLQRYDHVSSERVCSGIGLPNIYSYLKESGYADEPAWLAEKLAAAADPTPIIVNAAMDATDPVPLCRATLDLFIDILGAEAGNLALKTLASGGVYIGGGIPPRILPALTDGQLLNAFKRKGRVSYLMERMPLHIILNSKAGLLGSAHYGLTHW